MTYATKYLAIPLTLALAACGSGADDTDPGSGGSPPDAAATSPSESDGNRNDMPATPTGSITVEGRIAQGVECPIIETPDGKTWSIAMGEADFGAGDYVRITGDQAEMSICQQGRGTITPNRIDAIEPPARGRDPSCGGGRELSESYLTGIWVAKGADANCDDPDFAIRRSPGALVMEADIERHDNDAAIVLGNYPRLDLDEPMQDLPMERRGPDGVAILRPATDAAYEPVTIGSATITGDGIVFVKCSG